MLSGAAATEGLTTQLGTPFDVRQTGIGDAAMQGVGLLASLVRREAYVLAYIDAFWLIAWVSLAGIPVVLALKQSPPNPLTPPRVLP